MYTAMEVLEGECRMEQALIRDKRWRSLALLPISKNRQKYNVTKDSMQLLIDILKAGSCTSTKYKLNPVAFCPRAFESPLVHFRARP
jgi:septum formation inhibitor-activating ATPase MinD